MTAPPQEKKARTRLWFLVPHPDFVFALKPVCPILHGHQAFSCKKNHGVPPTAIWSGLVPDDELGDLRADLRDAKKKWRRAVKKWYRERQHLIMSRCAPAFLAYRKQLLEKHEAQKPQFTFTWEPMPS